MIPMVQRLDERLLSILKPELFPIEDLSIGPNDLFVVCGGFEDRATAVIQTVVASKCHILLINYEPIFKENKTSEIRGIAARVAAPLTEITYDRQNPGGFGEQLSAIAAAHSGRVIIDISAMSRILIVQLISALIERGEPISRCFIVYAEALNYPPTEESAREQLQLAHDDPTCAIGFLSSGIFQITLLPELASIAPDGTQTRLVVFPSLDSYCGKLPLN